MIYLKMTPAEKASLTKEQRKRGGLAAHYGPETGRIVIISMRECETVGVVNHEFMHKILSENSLETASIRWDSNFIGRLESWLGWLGLPERMMENFIWFAKKHF